MAGRSRIAGLRSSCFLLSVLCLSVAFAIASAHSHAGGSGSCPFASEDNHHHHHGDHHHHHHPDDGHDHHGGCDHGHGESAVRQKKKLLPEELAEEEDLKLEMAHGHGHGHHHHHFHGVTDEDLSILGLWLSAMGCSLLVSMASLVCLILLPVFFLRGKPSKLVVDSLATFGAGAMLGDAFLHQLPHAFGGGHSHSHDHHEAAHSHSHSLQDLSVGLSVLSGIVVFLLVEKLVRYVEEVSGKPHEGHVHHHHHSKSHKKLKNDCIDGSNPKSDISLSKETEASDVTTKSSSDKNYDSVKADKETEQVGIRKRGPVDGAADNLKQSDGTHHSPPEKIVASAEESMPSSSSLVFGYLNLFSDGVHNFTDGMALGSAFLLYGSVGGWSRTLFLLAHELPQEVGDFGILVRSGFTVSKALFFNFLSALAALFGTALALIIGKDPGQSSLIEGFTAGGFIYIAVAGVLPELNNEKTTFRSTALQLASLLLGIGVALCISLVE